MKNTLSLCLAIVTIAPLPATSAIGQTTADRRSKTNFSGCLLQRDAHSTDCGTSDLNKPDPNGEGPPNLIATVNGGARVGAEDSDGKLILPVPVKLVEDSHFRRFQELMSASAKADEKSLKENGSTLTLHRVAATFVGRIDSVSDGIHAFHLRRRETDRVDFLGFGQMGLFRRSIRSQICRRCPRLESFPPAVNRLSKNDKK